MISRSESQDITLSTLRKASAYSLSVTDMRRRRHRCRRRRRRRRHRCAVVAAANRNDDRCVNKTKKRYVKEIGVATRSRGRPMYRACDSGGQLFDNLSRSSSLLSSFLFCNTRDAIA